MPKEHVCRNVLRCPRCLGLFVCGVQRRRPCELRDHREGTAGRRSNGGRGGKKRKHEGCGCNASSVQENELQLSIEQLALMYPATCDGMKWCDCSSVRLLVAAAECLAILPAMLLQELGSSGDNALAALLYGLGQPKASSAVHVYTEICIGLLHSRSRLLEGPHRVTLAETTMLSLSSGHATLPGWYLACPCRIAHWPLRKFTLHTADRAQHA